MPQRRYNAGTVRGHVVYKSSIFVVQKATAPKNGVEFRQGSIGTIRSSLANKVEVKYHSGVWNLREKNKPQ